MSEKKTIIDDNFCLSSSSLVKIANTGNLANIEKQKLLKELSDQKFALDQSAIVSVTDASGNITEVNDMFCKVSGYSRSELIGQNHRIMKSNEHSKNFFADLWDKISRGQIWRGEICNLTKNGEPYWVYTTIVPFLDDEGCAYQYVTVRQDISNLKKAEQSITEQQEKLVANSMVSAIGEMASAITHEINNPLGVILGRCEMLRVLLGKDQIDRDTVLRVVDAIENTGRRIEKIVQSMRGLARHNQESEIFQIKPIAEIIGDSVELCFQRFRNSGVSLKVKDYDRDLNLECRPYQLVQVLVNLLNNAYDAVLHLDEKLVEVDVYTEFNKLFIAVTDSGKGIGLAEQDKIFQPFYSTKRVQYGTGLGLSVSRKILQKHQGDLVYCRDSAHTRFVLSLPLRQSKGVT